ncbi:MAG: radical SAM protein [Candidatus Aminicenantes bacterium]|nr:MAG: radical SAM protein [Candidatus Aminicenantes bacterium]
MKKISSLDFPIVLCGPNQEIYKPEFLEKNNFIEFVLFGEYEFTLLDLIKAISKGKKNFSHIKGLIWRDEKNNVIKNLKRPPFDINLLPWPYTDSLPMEKYCDLPGNIPHPSVQMVTSRGCPFSCVFCLWPQVIYNSRTYRTRNVIDVADEMEYFVREKGFKSVYFDDDTFNIDSNRIIRLCKEFVKRNLHNIPWAIMARPDLMNEELLEILKYAGLHAVKYGVESASQELVNKCGSGKNLDLKKAERNIKYTKSLGIKVHLTFCFGLPGETKETIKKTIDYALKLDPYSVQFSLLTPFPGTTLFEELDKQGRIITKDWSLYDGNFSCVFQPDNLSPSDLEEAKHFAYKLWGDYRSNKKQ